MRDIKFVFAFLALFVTITSASASEIVQLTDDTLSNSFPQWSPDGEKLVYVSSPGWYKAEIWIMDSDGNNKKQVTSGVTGFGLDNPWSPDGTKILYSSLEYWIMPCSWTYDVHTEERKKIDRHFDKSFISTDYLSLIYSTVFKKVYSKHSDGKDNIISCEWVFNGSKLFVVEGEDDTQKMWLLDPDGTNKSLLSALNGHNIRFLWQPDGNSILYVSNESGNYDIWVMNTDGSGKKQLTFTPENEYAMGIGFSPDGNKIVYASRNAFNRTNPSAFTGFFTTIWTMDADGANKKQLTDDNESWYYYPSWSPDGTKIAFEKRNDTTNRIDVVVMAADGSDMEILTANTSGGAFPEWSPEGDKIAFTSLEGEKSTISLIILDEEWRSAPAKTKLSVPAISQDSGKKTPGFGAVLTVLILLSRRDMRKK